METIYEHLLYKLVNERISYNLLLKKASAALLKYIAAVHVRISPSERSTEAETIMEVSKYGGWYGAVDGNILGLLLAGTK